MKTDDIKKNEESTSRDPFAKIATSYPEAALYKTIVDIVPNAILLSDMSGRVILANGRALELFGVEKIQEIEGALISDFVTDSHKETLAAAVARICTDFTLSDAEYPLLRPSGESFWGEISARSLPSTGSGTGKILFTIRDISERKHAEDDLRNLLVTDELTGLYNRRGFMIAADQELKHAKRIGRSIVLVFMDLDDLKNVNDKYGHSEGDALLRELAGLLRATFRESDIIARLGGDEFVVLALDVPEGSAATLVSRLRSALSTRDTSSSKPYSLSVSIGTTYYDPIDPCSLSELIMTADEAMYSDKKSKKH